MKGFTKVFNKLGKKFSNVKILSDYCPFSVNMCLNAADYSLKYKMLRIIYHYLLLVGTGMDELLGCLVLRRNNTVRLDNKHINALNTSKY